ncbi:hypothetical protein QAD02_014436 [Eretmocerus hayati]|uniref:Uncharacterized protein n=1 Tax=Eretmocerus hayati TaxID=131215 RepID=A0ACC2P7S6_9HYME|nr:hypothetical protein QAD02_014436 [Eretmocerus hayati]
MELQETTSPSSVFIAPKTSTKRPRSHTMSSASDPDTQKVIDADKISEGTPPIRDTEFLQLSETSNCSNSPRPRKEQCTIEQVDSFMKPPETAYLEKSKIYPSSFEDFKLCLRDCYGESNIANVVSKYTEDESNLLQQ